MIKCIYRENAKLEIKNYSEYLQKSIRNKKRDWNFNW